ncbi:methenyltetrahydromethanopterin cyclohydrolase [Pseudoflavonifractor sp. MSJ-37]|uniref:methenyltetrahydromethanopterin cyclohydrolase n=1 Tax=Pseudoflavonifractor sp. MSJ-37 TaxID=2841531 RepID=UPI001C11455D|nr:methenyltetrahydromethanopterin cyclohydrolase [Pseudoflavonifractor sp. MSJ-37]MBU5435781.1 hypothetical protein [Pseudoflavonifractor sp. MSJ-37]
MEWTARAEQSFQTLKQEAEAANCFVETRSGGTLIDAGWKAPGGWMAAKYVLEGLIGGRGQVSYTHRKMPDGSQIPALELFIDDPLGMMRSFVPDASGIYGVRKDGRWMLGVAEHAPAPEEQNGNVVTAASDSLFAGVLRAARLLARGVMMLQKEGITDIQWGWSSCPIAAMTADLEETERRRREMERSAAAGALWVRGDADAIRRALERTDYPGLRIHELVTAFTYGKG